MSHARPHKLKQWWEYWQTYGRTKKKNQQTMTCKYHTGFRTGYERCCSSRLQMKFLSEQSPTPVICTPELSVLHVKDNCGEMIPAIRLETLARHLNHLESMLCPTSMPKSAPEPRKFKNCYWCGGKRHWRGKHFSSNAALHKWFSSLELHVWAVWDIISSLPLCCSIWLCSGWVKSGSVIS